MLKTKKLAWAPAPCCIPRGSGELKGSGGTHSRQPARPRRPPASGAQASLRKKGRHPAELHGEAGVRRLSEGQRRTRSVARAGNQQSKEGLEAQAQELWRSRAGRRHVWAGEPGQVKVRGAHGHQLRLFRGQRATGTPRMCAPPTWEGSKRRKEAGTRRRSQQRRMTHDPHQGRQKPRRARDALARSF